LGYGPYQLCFYKNFTKQRETIYVQFCLHIHTDTVQLNCSKIFITKTRTEDTKWFWFPNCEMLTSRCRRDIQLSPILRGVAVVVLSELQLQLHPSHCNHRSHQYTTTAETRYLNIFISATKMHGKI
jgi:hypothetical protein